MGLIRFIKNKCNISKKNHIIPIYGASLHAYKSIPSINIKEQLILNLLGKKQFKKWKKLSKSVSADVQIDEDAHRDFKCWMRKFEIDKNKNIENWFKRKP